MSDCVLVVSHNLLIPSLVGGNEALRVRRSFEQLRLLFVMQTMKSRIDLARTWLDP